MNVYETCVYAQYVVGRYIWYMFIILMYICEKVHLCDVCGKHAMWWCMYEV